MFIDCVGSVRFAAYNLFAIGDKCFAIRGRALCNGRSCATVSIGRSIGHTLLFWSRESRDCHTASATSSVPFQVPRQVFATSMRPVAWPRALVSSFARFPTDSITIERDCYLQAFSHAKWPLACNTGEPLATLMVVASRGACSHLVTTGADGEIASHLSRGVPRSECHAVCSIEDSKSRPLDCDSSPTIISIRHMRPLTGMPLANCHSFSLLASWL